MNISEQIEQIIEERKKFLPQVEMAQSRVETARKWVDQLDAFRMAQGDALAPELMETLASISTDSFYREYAAAIKRLNHLYQRFSRGQIHISFVGRAGQGKSLLLQRISGLGNDVIPSADASDCTGVRSVISNTPGEKTKALITFYTEPEFVDIVNRYLNAILKSDSCRVASVDEISGLNMEELRGKIRYDQVTETALLEHLEKYVRHAQALRKKLGTSESIPEERIESYVAQYSRENPSVKYYTYLAVKESRILSAFPCTQCGKIVLVDTIGTGATSLGVEEAMLQTARDDSDAIVLMMRPDPLRPRLASEDYQLVDRISRAVSPEYAKQMLFWLVNRVETGKARNAERIPEIMAQLKKQELPVAQYFNVNCWDQREVQENLLIPILKQMSAQLSKIDRMIVERANEQLAALKSAYQAISARVERALGASVNQDERREFHRRIEATISQVTNDIRDLYLRREKEKEHPCATLQKAAAAKLKNVVCSVPSRETIIQRLNNGTINQHNALEQLTDQIRLQIINDFLELNSALHNTVLDMKREVVHILATTGRLGAVVGVDPGDPDIWLHVMRKKLDEAQFPMLRRALEPLEQFDLRMENFLIYKVRCCLKPIDWSANPDTPQLYNGLHNKQALADEIASHLRYFLEIVYQKIEDELTNFYIFPNTALYAVLRDFYDRAVCMRNEDGETVKTEWQYLYEDKIPIIWAKEHREYTATAGRAEEWRTLTENIHACTAEEYFTIDVGKESVSCPERLTI